MSRQSYRFLSVFASVLLSFSWLHEVTASTEKEHINPAIIFPATGQEIDVIAQGSVQLDNPTIQPLGDTYCFSDDTGQGLICKGAEDSTSLRFTPVDDDIVHITLSASNASNTRPDVTVLGVSVDGFLLPENKDIDEWEIHCRKVVKTEPPDESIANGQSRESELTGSDDLKINGELPHLFDVPKSKRIRKTVCPGCKKDFKIASKLSHHRQTSTDTACKGGYTTVCPGCKKDFKTASKLKNHRQTSTDTACKAKTKRQKALKT